MRDVVYESICILLAIAIDLDPQVSSKCWLDFLCILVRLEAGVTCRCWKDLKAPFKQDHTIFYEVSRDLKWV